MKAWRAPPHPADCAPPPPNVCGAFRLPSALPRALPRNGPKTAGNIRSQASGAGQPDSGPDVEAVDRHPRLRFGGRAFGELPQLQESICGHLESAPRAQQGTIGGGDCRFQAGDFLADVRVGLGRSGGVRCACAVAVLESSVSARGRRGLPPLRPCRRRRRARRKSGREARPIAARGLRPTRAARYRWSARNRRTRTWRLDRLRRSAA